MLRKPFQHALGGTESRAAQSSPSKPPTSDGANSTSNASHRKEPTLTSTAAIPTIKATPRPPTRKRLEGIYEIEESIPTLNTSFVEAFSFLSFPKSVLSIRDSIPLLYQLIAEIGSESGLSLLILLWGFSQLVLSLLPAYQLFLSSQIVNTVQEAIDTRGLKDQNEFAFIAIQRILCSTIIRLLRAFSFNLERKITGKVAKGQARKLLYSRLRISLGVMNDPDTQRLWETAGGRVQLGDMGDGGANFRGLSRSITSLLSAVEVMSQAAVLWDMLKARKSDRLYALMAVLSYATTRMDFSGHSGFSWMIIVDRNFLKMRRLYDMGTQSKFKAEVEALALKDHILTEFDASHQRLGTTSTRRPLSAGNSYGSFSLGAILQDLLEQLPTVLFAYQAIQTPSHIPLSLASINLIQSTTMQFARKLDRIASVGEGFESELEHTKSLEVLLGIGTGLQEGDSIYGSDIKASKEGMEIEFKSVAYAYPGNEKLACEAFSFRLPPGSLTVVVGSNGSGKSTMLKLLGRLNDPTSGTVFVNGRNIKDYRLKELRQAMAIGWQDYVHFPLSIGENIALGNTSIPFSQTAVECAAHLAGAHHFISKLSEGYETNLAPAEYGSGSYRGRGGSKFDSFFREQSEKRRERKVEMSGGQWQRLALARTMMKAQSDKVELLVFDEPSASLDPKAEFELFGRLNELRKGRTSLYVSHRFGAFNKQADLLLYMDDGRIVERGTHDELMRAGGKYAEIYRMQASAFE